MRSILGAFLIIIGLLAFFDVSNIVHIDFWEILGDWWPSIFIVLGINNLIKTNSKLSSISLILIGLIWIISNLNFISLSFWDLIAPMIFILLGIHLVTNKKGKEAIGVNSDEYLNISAIFSGQKQKFTSDNFKGGKIEAIFSGVEVDLREATVSPEFEYLEIDASFGGVELWLPRDIIVVIDGSPIFSGLKNNVIKRNNEELPVINIKYSAIFSGIDIKN